MSYGAQYPGDPRGDYGPVGEYGQYADYEPGSGGRIDAYYDDSQYPWDVNRQRRRRRWILALVLLALIPIGYLGYTKVYVPRMQPAHAALVPAPVFPGQAAASSAPPSAAATASPSATASSAATPSATVLPTQAWKPWLAGNGGKAFRAMALSDTALVDARQKAQAAIKSGKNIPGAGSALLKAAAAASQAATNAGTVPLPPKVAQAAWVKAQRELAQGSVQLATVGQDMRVGNKAAASSAIKASMPGMTSAFNDLTAVQLKIPAP